MISNPFEDIVPAKYRKYLYAAIALAALVFGAWQASEGNLGLFIGSLIVTLSHATAASNTSAADSDYLSSDPGQDQ